MRDTGFIDREEIIREDAGVRGPQRVSVLYPHDGKTLVQVCPGIKGISEFDSNIDRFRMESLREEANLIHGDVFNMFRTCFPDISQLHRLLQLKCVKDWVGWQ